MRVLTMAIVKDHTRRTVRLLRGVNYTQRTRRHNFHIISAKRYYMGGSGSGEWQRERRATVEELTCLTLACLKPGYFSDEDKIGCVHERTSRERGFVTLWEKGGHFRETIGLEYSAQPLGGRRTWFQCPFCQCKTTRLYLQKYRLICRTCADLSYQSRQLSDFKRSRQQAEKISARLQSRDYVLMSIPPRPKGMHRKKYQSLITKLLECHDKSMAHADTKAQKIAKHLGF